MSFDRHIASVSFGKDSLAMVLLILERGLPLDEVVFYDTGMEFKAIYDTRDRIIPILDDHGVKYTELRPPRPFMFDMLEKPVTSKKNGLHYGYSWCGGCARWGTANKTSALDKHAKAAGRDVIQYIGIAADEQKRLQRLPLYKVAPWRSSASPKPTPWPIATTAASSGRKTESGFMTFWTACPVGAVRIRI